MPDTVRRLLRAFLPLAALGVIAAGLWPSGATPPTRQERIHAVASQVRCPFCGGESVAEAPSQIARDLEGIIGEQVDAGYTDDEILAFFVARYGESALLDPPLIGWGWVLWTAPLAALAGGAVTIGRRRRTRVEPPTDLPADLERARLAEHLRQIAGDVQELDGQVAAGEIDEARRRDLADGYEDEAVPLRARLAVLDEVDGLERDLADLRARIGDATDPSEDAELIDRVTKIERDLEGRVPAATSPRRALAGAAILAAGALSVSLLLVRDTGAGDGVDVPSPPPIDLSTITVEELEAVVARNPDVIGMRLALAQLYMDQGDVSAALGHFGQVLERERNPEALAWVGFISWQAGELDAAESFLDEALQRAPDYPQAQWWLANLLFFDRDDPEGAAPLLEAMLASADLPDDVRVQAEDLLAQAGGAS
ncbi:MAG TPA: cytochrome c-type biogenesis protein CcmH [Acidimicrobiia bacterium]